MSYTGLGLTRSTDTSAYVPPAAPRASMPSAYQQAPPPPPTPTCKQAYDAKAIADCWWNFEGCRALTGDLGRRYPGLTPTQAHELPVCRVALRSSDREPPPKKKFQFWSTPKPTLRDAPRKEKIQLRDAPRKEKIQLRDAPRKEKIQLRDAPPKTPEQLALKEATPPAPEATLTEGPSRRALMAAGLVALVAAAGVGYVVYRRARKGST